jgi:hypothetical protein
LAVDVDRVIVLNRFAGEQVGTVDLAHLTIPLLSA